MSAARAQPSEPSRASAAGVGEFGSVSGVASWAIGTVAAPATIRAQTGSTSARARGAPREIQAHSATARSGSSVTRYRSDTEPTKTAANSPTWTTSRAVYARVVETKAWRAVSRSRRESTIHASAANASTVAPRPSTETSKACHATSFTRSAPTSVPSPTGV